MNAGGWRFVGTPLDLTEGEAYHLQKYWKKAQRAGAIIVWDRFELDKAALQSLVLLDCANCHRAHRESCCEGGYPFPPATELLQVVDEHLPVIAARHLDAETRDHLQANGLYESYLETAGHPTIGTFGGNCLFCRVEGAGPACMAHRYAIEEGKRPEALKPLSCLLYPLDLIENAEGRVRITALTEATSRFSRWGVEYRHDFLCAHYELRAALAAGTAERVRPNIRRQLPADAFPLDRYRPAWQEGLGLLNALYGEELCAVMEACMCKEMEKEEAPR
ncbi:MAG: hypothetical protein WCC10_12480 [Tumebacillaceae bacterium]